MAPGRDRGPPIAAIGGHDEPACTPAHPAARAGTAAPAHEPADDHRARRRTAARDGARLDAGDLIETDDAYLVEIELPGVRRRDLTVEVTGVELRVDGALVEKEKVGWLRHRTRRVGRFAYRATLPRDIDTGHISADLTGGVLTVRAPKTEAARRRRITVNAG